MKYQDIQQPIIIDNIYNLKDLFYRNDSIFFGNCPI